MNTKDRDVGVQNLWLGTFSSIPYIEYKNGIKSDVVKVGIKHTEDSASFRGSVDVWDIEFWKYAILNSIREDYHSVNIYKRVEESLDFVELEDLEICTLTHGYYHRAFQDVPVGVTFKDLTEEHIRYMDFRLFRKKPKLKTKGVSNEDKESKEDVYSRVKVEEVKDMIETGILTGMIRREDYFEGYFRGRVFVDKYLEGEYGANYYYLYGQGIIKDTGDTIRNVPFDLLASKSGELEDLLSLTLETGVNFLKGDDVIFETDMYVLKFKHFRIEDNDLLIYLIYNNDETTNNDKIQRVFQLKYSEDTSREDSQEYLNYISKMI